MYALFTAYDLSYFIYLQMEDFMAFEYCFRDVRNKGISNDIVETIEQ